MAGNYIESQTPIMQNGDFYYPLTTSKQIILPDGRRLGGAEGLNLNATDVNALTVDVSDYVEGSANLINADTLGGVAADGYVLETELDTYKNEVDSFKNDVTNNYALKSEIPTTADEVGARASTWLPSYSDIKKMTFGTWNGNTVPDDIPVGITYVTAAATSEGHGFPVGYCTVLAIKEDATRLFQILIVKTNGKMQIRSATDGTTWGEWQTYLRDYDTAADSEKLGGYESTAFVRQIDSFTPTDGKITLISTVTGTKGSAVSQMYLYGYKYGHMVIINVGFNLTSAPSTWTQTVILTGLPASRNNMQFGTVSSQDDGISHVIYVDTSGNMLLRSDAVSAGTKFYRGQIIYLTP